MGIAFNSAELIEMAERIESNGAISTLKKDSDIDSAEDLLLYKL